MKPICILLFFMMTAGLPHLRQNPVYRGLYVDALEKVIGNAPAEDSLLRWCRQEGFNVLTLYDAARVVEAGKDSALAAFIFRARHSGIKEVTAVIEHDPESTETLVQYNSHHQPKYRIDYFNLELEWWNKAASFDDFLSHLRHIRARGRSLPSPVKTEIYIGWFANPEGKPFEMADSLIGNCDRILIHDYQKNPEWSYIGERMTALAAAAKKRNRVFPVSVIFSAEADFSGAYFQQHHFGDAFRQLAASFDTAHIEGKTFLRLEGYQIFTYTIANKVRAQ